MNILSQVQQEFPSLSVEHTTPVLGYEYKYLLPFSQETSQFSVWAEHWTTNLKGT